MKKNFFIIVFFVFIISILPNKSNAYSSDPKQFISEIVAEAKKILVETNSQEFKTKKLSEMALKTVDIKGIGYYTLGNYRSSVFLRGKFYKKMYANDYYKKFVQKNGMKTVLRSFHALEKNHDLIIIEGAGSPAEINLTQYDIANMKLAEKTKSPVILITDIERGGSFGSIVGTLSLLEKKYQKMIKGFVFNKFRGDLDILKPGFRKLKQNTGKPVFGTIPLTKFLLPEEDSITSDSKQLALNNKNLKKIDSEIAKLSKVVKSSLNIRAIEKLL